MTGEVKLDQGTFKALAGETRVKILKSLKERKKYLSELSEELEMSNSSVKEQLDNLIEARLIEKEEERKWKYYKLTRKGEKIMSKKRAKAYILLSSSILAGLVGMFMFLRNKVISIGSTMRTAGSKAAPKAVETVNETNQALQRESGKLVEEGGHLAQAAPGNITSSANETINQTMGNATGGNITQKAVEKASAESSVFTSSEFLLMVIGLTAAVIIFLWIKRKES